MNLMEKSKHRKLQKTTKIENLKKSFENSEHCCTIDDILLYHSIKDLKYLKIFKNKVFFIFSFSFNVEMVEIEKSLRNCGILYANKIRLESGHQTEYMKGS